MRPKTHIAVLRGGMSAEYEVSMNSGEMILAHLDTERYDVTPIEITRNGEWVFDGGDYLDFADAVPKLKGLHPDCVVVALHGPYGEDGRIQGLLDLMGIPYTGSGAAASAIAIDKERCKALVEHAGINVPRDLVFTRAQWHEDAARWTQRVNERIGFPCVVKSPRQGSSLGMGIPQTEAEFDPVVEEVLGFGYRVLVEEYIQGRELTCSVLDTEEIENPVALPVTEIRPVKAKFFDYTAKYTPKASDEITPAEIEDLVRAEVQRVALLAHQTVGCRGFSRSDMIERDGIVYFLEINTIPGFTKTSLYPQAAAAAGIPFAEMLRKFIDAAMM